MTSLDVKMNYDSMENMEKAFQAAAQQVQDSANQMKQIAQQLDGGALKGQAGDAFKEAVSNVLVPAMNTIAEKMTQLKGDINGAVLATRDGVSTAQSRFK